MGDCLDSLQVQLASPEWQIPIVSHMAFNDLNAERTIDYVRNF